MDDYRAEKLYAIQFTNGWHYAETRVAADDARRRGLTVIEYVPADQLRGAVGEAERLREVIRWYVAQRGYVLAGDATGGMPEAWAALQAAAGGR